MPITGFDIDVDELRECAKRLKRPWMMDSRGIPPMALLGGDGLLQAIVPCLQQLLAYDDDWDCLEESGYVKLKVAGGVTATKLRAIIPQSTVVRLLSDLILLRFRPLMDTYSASKCACPAGLWWRQRWTDVRHCLLRSVCFGDRPGCRRQGGSWTDGC